MGFSLIPTRIYPGILYLTPEDFKREGIRVVFADLDNTLSPYKINTASPELISWTRNLENEGLQLFVVSNSRKPTRVQEFCASLGIEFIRHAGKPKRGGFREAMRRTGAKPEECVMLGDQIFTDVLGANRAGIPSWLIMPMRLDAVPRTIRFWFEGIFRIFCKQDMRKNYKKGLH